MVVHVLIPLMLFLLAKGDEFNYTLRLHQRDSNGAIVGYDFSNDSFMMFRRCLEDFSTKTCYADYNHTTIVNVYNETEVRNTSESWCFTCESNKTKSTIACYRSDSVYPRLIYLSIDYSEFNSNCFIKALPTTLELNDSSSQCFICSRPRQTTTDNSQYSQTTEANSGLTSDSKKPTSQTTLLTPEQPTATTLSTTTNSSPKEVIESTQTTIKSSQYSQTNEAISASATVSTLLASQTMLSTSKQPSTPSTTPNSYLKEVNETITDHTRTLTKRIPSNSVTYTLHSTSTTYQVKTDWTPTESVLFIATTTVTAEHTSTSEENNFQNSKDFKTQDNTIYIIIGVVVAVVLVAIIIISVIVYRRRKPKLAARNRDKTIHLSTMGSHDDISIEANDGVYVDVFRDLSDASTTSVVNNEYIFCPVDGDKETPSYTTDNGNDRVTVASVSNRTYDVMTLTSQNEPIVSAEKPLDSNPVEPIYSIANKSSNANSNTLDLDQGRKHLASAQEHDYNKLRDPSRKFKNPYDYS